MTNRIKANIPFYLSIAAAIFLFFIVESSLLSKNFFALSADESGHTLEAYEWYKGEGQLFSIWLPFFKLVNGLALKIYYDLFVTPRIMSWLFGLLTLLSLIILTHQLFENKIVAILTGFLATLFLPIVVFSALPLIEIYFFFFMTASIAFFLLWLRNGKNKFLWLTAIFLSVGTTTRYEAWVFALFLFLIIAYQLFKSHKTSSQKATLIISFALIITAFPVYWIYLSTIANESAHGFVSSVTNRYNEGRIFSEIKNNALYQFLIINITSLNIIGLASLFYLVKINPNVKKYSIILFGTLLTFSVLSFVIKAMPTHNYWRIAMIWSLLLLPFTAYWLYHLLDTSNSSPVNKYGFIIFFILLIYFFNSQMTQYTSLSYFTRDDINIGNFLNKITTGDQSSKIYVMKDGSDKWRYSNILVASQKPEQFVLELHNFDYVSSDTISVDQQLISEMVIHKIKFVLIPSRTIVKKGAEFFNKIKVFKKWKVYQINLIKDT